MTRVLKRGRSLLVGTYLGKGRFSADAHRVSRELQVEGEAQDGDKVLVGMSKKGVRIRQVLGRAGTPAVEDSAVLAELYDDLSASAPMPLRVD